MLTALAVVVSAVGAVLFVSAPPASAVDAPFQPQIDTATGNALARLRTRPACNAMLSGRVSAIDALGTADSDYLPVSRTGNQDAPASVPFTLDGGLGQTITYHDAFAQLGDTQALRFSANRELFPGEDGLAQLQRMAALQQELAVLHEVGHLTGAEGLHLDDVTPDGFTLSGPEEEAFYNTRILNTCFTEQFLVAGLSCSQNIVHYSIFDIRSTLDCFGGCVVGQGTMALSWSSNLRPGARVDTTLVQDGEVCFATRTSECPSPGPGGGRTMVTLTVTNLAGRSSSDTVFVDCLPANIGLW